MAKAFYSMDEVCELLGKSQEEVKELVRGGTLREFRDAGKIFFKAEDVDKLSGGSAAASEDSGEIMLEPAPEELPTVADAEGTSVIGLEAVQEPGSAEQESKKDTVITASGIGVFDDDELEIDADPMAETQITAGAPEDEVSLEGTGSGSGLLDLTREADDTSLGAELLDEIYPGEEEAIEAEAPAVPEEPAAEEEAEAEPAAAPVTVVETAPPAYVAAGDPSEGLFSGLMVGTLILLALAGSVVAGMLQGFFPDYAKSLSNHFLYFLLGSVAVPIVALLIGWVISKAAAPKRA
ncbi:MAG: helix-turn-helix domain-containing protein [Phycisphaerae bacterium]